MSQALSIIGISGGELSPDDARLLRGLRAGIEASYEELIDRFQQPVYGMVFRLLGNQTDACDVVQEVFVKVFRGVASFREKSSLRTWIYRIAVNEAHNHRRWFYRHSRWETAIANEEVEARVFDSTVDPGPSPFESASSNETRALIEGALERINPVFRTAVVLRDIEDLSYEEIAEILQISMGTVKSRILRGREALRRELNPQFETKYVEAFSLGQSRV